MPPAGHGKEFNSTYTGEVAKKEVAEGEPPTKPRDRFYDCPPPGREDPAVEIKKALTKMKECNVIKRVLLFVCLLIFPPCRVRLLLLLCPHLESWIGSLFGISF